MAPRILAKTPESKNIIAWRHDGPAQTLLNQLFDGNILFKGSKLCGHERPVEVYNHFSVFSEKHKFNTFRKYWGDIKKSRNLDSTFSFTCYIERCMASIIVLTLILFLFVVPYATGRGALMPRESIDKKRLIDDKASEDDSDSDTEQVTPLPKKHRSDPTSPIMTTKFCPPYIRLTWFSKEFNNRVLSFCIWMPSGSGPTPIHARQLFRVTNEGSTLEMKVLWAPKLQNVSELESIFRDINHGLHYPEVVGLQQAIQQNMVSKVHGVE